MVSFPLLLLACADAGSTSDSTADAEDIAPDSTTSAQDSIVQESRTVGWMLLINEFNVAAKDGGGGDWIELYNAGTVDADLAEVVLQTNGDSAQNRSLASLGALAPAQFLLLESGVGSFGVGVQFGLNWEGDVIGVCDVECVAGAGDRLSYSTYAADSSGLTRSRAPDGGEAWTYSTPTPGVENQ